MCACFTCTGQCVVSHSNALVHCACCTDAQRHHVVVARVPLRHQPVQSLQVDLAVRPHPASVPGEAPSPPLQGAFHFRPMCMLFLHSGTGMAVRPNYPVLVSDNPGPSAT
jgi:hypothetical protein